MADYPALPLWTDAYLADLHPRLSLEEHGAMILLMQFAWRSPQCRLPDDDKQLAKMLAIPEGHWKKKLRPVLGEIWKINGGFWTQKRLLREKDYVENRRTQQSEAGKRSALKRKKTDSTTVDSPLPASLDASLQREGQGNGNPHTHTHTHTQRNVTSEDRERVAAEAFRLAGIDPERDFQNASANYAQVATWLNAGADPERHIYPAIEAVMANRDQPPDTLRYFDKAVRRNLEHVPAGPTTAGNGKAPHPEPPKHSTEREQTHWWRIFTWASKRGANPANWMPEYGECPFNTGERTGEPVFNPQAGIPRELAMDALAKAKQGDAT